MNGEKAASSRVGDRERSRIEWGLQGGPGGAYSVCMAKAEDTNRPGGWLVEETIPGSGAKRYFKVYELDEEKAVELARAYGATGRAKAVKKLNVDEFTGADMRPGDVKEHR
jgi:hypothetical protein